MSPDDYDPDDVTADLARKVDEWVKEERRERRNPEWYPDVHEVFEIARDRFERGDF